MSPQTTAERIVELWQRVNSGDCTVIAQLRAVVKLSLQGSAAQRLANIEAVAKGFAPILMAKGDAQLVDTCVALQKLTSILLKYAKTDLD